MCAGVGKSSLVNTFARYLRHPKDVPMPVLTQDNPDLLCTQVMQLYDKLSINKMKTLSVKVEELTPSVKLVKLEPNLPPVRNIWNKFTSLFTKANPEAAKGFQVKMVDMGGHTATALKAFHSIYCSKLDQS